MTPNEKPAMTLKEQARNFAIEWMKSPERRMQPEESPQDVVGRMLVKFALSLSTWTRCDSGKLPKASGPYLVCFKGRVFDAQFFAGNEPKWIENGHYFEPTHWRPLPLPPEDSQPGGPGKAEQ